MTCKNCSNCVIGKKMIVCQVRNAETHLDRKACGNFKQKLIHQK